MHVVETGCLGAGCRCWCWIQGICFPSWVLVVGFPVGLSPTSFHLFPTSLICLPLLFICVPRWVPPQAAWYERKWETSRPAWLRACSGLSPTSFHLFPTSFHLSPSSFHCLPGWVLVVGPGLSPTSFHLSPTSFHVSSTSCWVLVVGFPARLSPTSFHLSPRLGAISPPGLSLLVSALFRWPCSISIHVSPRSVTGGVRPFPLAMKHFCSFVSQVRYCWCPPFSVGHATVLFICFRPPFSIHLSFRSVTAGVRPSGVRPSGVRSVSPPFSAGHVAFLFICLPGLPLLVSAM